MRLAAAPATRTVRRETARLLAITRLVDAGGTLLTGARTRASARANVRRARAREQAQAASESLHEQSSVVSHLHPWFLCRCAKIYYIVI
jgi:hypothetical protein